MTFASDFFDAMPHEASVYTDSVGSFPLRVVVNEIDKALRIDGGDELIGSSVVGVVLTDARVRRGGRLVIADREYRIDGVLGSRVPGMSDLKLERVAGNAVPVVDATNLVPLDETVTIDGVSVPANVNRSVEVVEIGRDGTRQIVTKTMVAIREIDAPTLKAGQRVGIDGRNRPVASVMNDGLGFLKVMV